MGARAAAPASVARWLDRLPRRLRAHKVDAAYLFGSHARGDADALSDVDLIVVAPSTRPFVDRFRDYRDVWFAAPTGVDLLVYTPEEFSRHRKRNRFLRHVLKNARRIV